MIVEFKSLLIDLVMVCVGIKITAIQDTKLIPDTNKYGFAQIRNCEILGVLRFVLILCDVLTGSFRVC